MISTTKFSSKSWIWVTLALLINTSLKVFKLVNIVLHKLFWVTHTSITPTFGHWLVQYLNLWLTISFLSLRKSKAFQKTKIICTRCYKFWARCLSNLQLEGLKVLSISTKKANWFTEIQRSNFQSVSFWLKIMVMMQLSHMKQNSS